VAERLETGLGKNIPKQIEALESLHLSAMNTAAKAPEKYHEYDFNLQFHLAYVQLGGNDRNV
jgi:DNA-binding FadR family transcriptional regulator